MTTTSQLQITTQLDGDKLSVTAVILPGGFLPANIFLCENTGTTTLGCYIGVCDTDELTRFQAWTNVAIPKFGNSFVRSDQAKIVVDGQIAANSVIATITKGVTNLSAALKLAASSTQIITIE